MKPTGMAKALSALLLAVSGWGAAGEGVLEFPDVRATVLPARDIGLRCFQGGVVHQIGVQVGGRVKHGQPLVQMDTTLQRLALRESEVRMELAQLRVRTAEAALQAARESWKRAKMLLERGTATAAELAAVQAEVGRAEHGVHEARTAIQLAQLALERNKILLDRLSVRAPLDGTVAEMHVDAGDAVEAGGPLLRIVDVARLRAVAELSPAHAAKVTPDTRVEMRIDGLPEVYPGQVALVAPVADPETGRVRVEAAIRNDEGAIIAGSRATVRFLVDRGGL